MRKRLKSKKLFIIGILLCHFNLSKAQVDEEEPYATLALQKKAIIGTWMNTGYNTDEVGDHNWTMKFTTEGKCYWYYTGDDVEIYTYTITPYNDQGYDAYALKIKNIENPDDHYGYVMYIGRDEENNFDEMSLSSGLDRPWMAPGNFVFKKIEASVCPPGKVIDSMGNCVNASCKTTMEDLQKVFPNNDSGTLKEIADLINQYGKDFEIDSKEKLQHFLAQSGHESRSLSTGNPLIVFEERFNYYWGLLGVKGYWSQYFNSLVTMEHKLYEVDYGKADPRDYKWSDTYRFVNPEKFANRVYNDAYRDSNHKLGNTQPGDGYKYRGRGLFQLKGRNDYTLFNGFYRQYYDSTVDILARPELLVRDNKIMLISGMWYFKNHVINHMTISDKTKTSEVTQYINPRYKHLADRKKLFEKMRMNIRCH